MRSAQNWTGFIVHFMLLYIYKLSCTSINYRERSGSVVECLTGDREAAGSSLIGITALWSLRHIYPSLVLVQPRKTRPCKDQARGRLGRNSHPRGRNFALNGTQGEVGVSLKKKNFFFFWGRLIFILSRHKCKLWWHYQTIYYHCMVFFFH